MRSHFARKLNLGPAGWLVSKGSFSLSWCQSPVLTYAFRRLLWIIPVLLVASIITFGLMHAAPGSPWNRESNPLDADTIAALNARYGLDQPLPVQYVRWLDGILHGDFGSSFDPGALSGMAIPFKIEHTDVASVIGQAAGPSLQLGLMAFALAVLLGIPLGVVAALRHNGPVDHLATGVSLLGLAAPAFLLAIVLQLALGKNAYTGEGLFPTKGWDDPISWVLPTVALAALPMAQVARYTRASMLEVVGRDYVRTAESKGLGPSRIVGIHMLRNALIPVVTILGPILATLITGSIVVETVFQIPGIGALYIGAIHQHDYGVIMTMTLIYAAAVALINVVVDLSYGILDPRVRP